MTYPESDVEEEEWDDVPYFTPELIDEMRRLGDRAATAHTWIYGPGGRWDTEGDLIC